MTTDPALFPAVTTSVETAKEYPQRMLAYKILVEIAYATRPVMEKYGWNISKLKLREVKVEFPECVSVGSAHQPSLGNMELLIKLRNSKDPKRFLSGRVLLETILLKLAKGGRRSAFQERQVQVEMNLIKQRCMERCPNLWAIWGN
ncbi:hypothetical protein KEM56_003894 [Ascosphaera pollenicola]|nr:hypothetical protein KEM56_003894 [Ascosphaera pollenicola]